jgi:hypothetical protein
MAIATAIAVAGLAVAAYGAYSSTQAASAQASTAKKAAKLTEVQNNLRSRRSQRQAIRMANIATAKQQSRASAAGVGSGSTALTGGTTGGELGRNLLANSQNKQGADQRSQLTRESANNQYAMSMGNAAQQVGGSMFTSSEKLGKIAEYTYGKVTA